MGLTGVGLAASHGLLLPGTLWFPLKLSALLLAPGEREGEKKSLGDSEEQGSLLEGKQTSQKNSRKAGERKGEISIRSMHHANPA